VITQQFLVKNPQAYMYIYVLTPNRVPKQKKKKYSCLLSLCCWWYYDMV